MRLTHPEYVKLVLRTYQLYRSTPEFSPALKQATPASIRKECLTIYKERPDKKDEPILRSFFGPAEENSSFYKSIESFPTEKFKTLSNYLKGKAANTEDRNVEMLAWLIDFPHRPYWFGMNVILSEREKAMLNSEESVGGDLLQEIEEAEDTSDAIKDQILQNELEDNTAKAAEVQAPLVATTPLSEPKPGEKWLKVNKKWVVVGVAFLCILLLSGLYLHYDKGDHCMYWTGDHYEPTPCNEKLQGRLLIALDEERVKNFRKITRVDTITEGSIGKIYYLKTNKVLEYFTAGGKHPIYLDRSLKVLSQYMFDTYLRKQISGTDSLALLNKKPL